MTRFAKDIDVDGNRFVVGAAQGAFVFCRSSSSDKTVVLTRVRYALATICFALSVACLGLWWRSYTVYEQIYCQNPISSGMIYVSALRGVVYIGPADARTVPITWRYAPIVIPGNINISADATSRYGPLQFGWYGTGYYFPLWYPALVFALAGIGALRLGRRFTLRSALIATTVVAGLLGMVVTL